MKLIQKKSKHELTLKKQEESEYNFSSKKELARLKAAYKKGKLKFDSKEVAKSILNDCKRGLLDD